MRNAAATLVLALAAALAVAALSVTALAGAQGVGQLQQQVSSSKAKVGALGSQLGATSSRLGSLNGNIATVSGRLGSQQTALTRDIAALSATQEQYTITHQRLLRLERYAARASQTLRRQIVGQYEAGPTDLLTVVLDAGGFQQLLDNLNFVGRIQRRDAHVVTAVRSARRAVSAAAIRLGAIEVRQRQLTNRVLAERNVLEQALQRLQTRRSAVAGVQAAKRAALDSARTQLASLQGQLNKAEQAAVRSAASVTAGALLSAPAASLHASASGFVFPLPISAAAPPSAWSPDQGVDISAPGGTPEYAVCSGTIVLHGIGGFGPWAPVLHCDSPLAGYSYVYYGHAGPANQLPVGTHVNVGQVMSEIGPGIVGISSGPHIEIGFCDSSGTPLGNGTAATMEALLRSAY